MDMEEPSKRKPIIISILLLFAVTLPVFGFYSAAYIEYEYIKESRRDGAWFWSVCVLLAVLSLAFAHMLAARRYQFKSLYPLLLLSLVASAGSIGFVSSNAANNEDSFSGYLYPDYVIRQQYQKPNHFLYLGDIELGSARAVASEILGAKNVNWDKPVVLEISSRGGMAQEGMLLGQFVEQYDIHIEVMDRCFSACAYALVSSDYRYVHPRAWVGFHAAYNGSKDVPSYDSPSLRFYNEALDNRMVELGISLDFRALAGVQSMEMYYPSFEDLEQEGIVNQLYRKYLSSNRLPYYY
jgi:hypothetical protein